MKHDPARAAAEEIQRISEDYFGYCVGTGDYGRLMTYPVSRVEKVIRKHFASPSVMVPALRGLESGHICDRCGGLGVRDYASTSTWRGGPGGSAMTRDVCDQCWGSGSDDPWPSHREMAIPERNAKALALLKQWQDEDGEKRDAVVEAARAYTYRWTTTGAWCAEEFAALHHAVRALEHDDANADE